ncbi:MFS transporter [Limnoglobus roseus]|uniref:MFS transporter n=1 Tax=Limnoglobus roseus TaxID=2598579 RepID=A0A5C1A8X4_9BACT|nr:MFS transporter [Limnoglobus roseus]QEL13558.1 MFS transporter [Limnoglobus roseus]
MTTPTPALHAGLSPIVKALVVIVAAIGFLFDTYELLMFPVIGSDAISELVFHKAFQQLTPPEIGTVQLWSGRMLWIAALAGGACGLIGGWLIDRLGRKTIMVASIFIYSLSPVAAAYSSELWQLILFRCTTFIGVCVELVAAVTWLAELFHEKRTREIVIGWTLAMASLGGILVTEVYTLIVEYLKEHPEGISGFPVTPAAWRYTLLTGLIPGAMILLLLPFVPESFAWRKRKLEGTLKRPSLGELFTPQLRRTTLVTAILSGCGYAAAFGALQMTPLGIVPGLPDLAARSAEVAKADKEAVTPEQKKEVGAMRKALGEDVKARRGNIQRWQEVGGLVGRIILAVLLVFVPSRTLLRLFLVPGIVLLPVTYLFVREQEYTLFAAAIFFCGLLTVAQFSYLSEFLPRVFPVHLRGTGGGFATNVGGRMIGTMAATLNTEFLSKQFAGSPPVQVATAAAVIGGTVYLIAFLASFFLPNPPDESA